MNRTICVMSLWRLKMNTTETDRDVQRCMMAAVNPISSRTRVRAEQLPQEDTVHRPQHWHTMLYIVSNASSSALFNSCAISPFSLPLNITLWNLLSLIALTRRIVRSLHAAVSTVKVWDSIGRRRNAPWEKAQQSPSSHVTQIEKHPRPKCPSCAVNSTAVYPQEHSSSCKPGYVPASFVELSGWLPNRTTLDLSLDNSGRFV